MDTLPRDIVFRIISYLPIQKIIELNLLNKDYWEIYRQIEKDIKYNKDVDWERLLVFYLRRDIWTKELPISLNKILKHGEELLIDSLNNFIQILREEQDQFKIKCNNEVYDKDERSRYILMDYNHNVDVFRAHFLDNIYEINIYFGDTLDKEEQDYNIKLLYIEGDLELLQNTNNQFKKAESAFYISLTKKMILYQTIQQKWGSFYTNIIIKAEIERFRLQGESALYY